MIFILPYIATCQSDKIDICLQSLWVNDDSSFLKIESQHNYEDTCWARYAKSQIVGSLNYYVLDNLENYDSFEYDLLKKVEFHLAKVLDVEKKGMLEDALCDIYYTTNVKDESIDAICKKRRMRLRTMLHAALYRSAKSELNFVQAETNRGSDCSKFKGKLMQIILYKTYFIVQESYFNRQLYLRIHDQAVMQVGLCFGFTREVASEFRVSGPSSEFFK